MHSVIRFVAIYASISALVSAAIFIGYLEVYTWVAKGVLTLSDPLNWRTAVPKMAMWMTGVFALTGVVASFANILGL